MLTLLVEDNQTIRDNLIATLEEVTALRVDATTETEAGAVLWLRSHVGGWRLAIVDLFLKEGTGFGVLEACRDRGSHQRVVLLTNFATASVRLRAASLGADRVFDKSTELDGFLTYCAEK